MRRSFVLARAGFTLATLVSAASLHATPPDETAHSAAAVKAVDQHWLDAEVGGDTAYLEALLLPAYRSVGADGMVHPRQAILDHAAKNRGSDKERRRVEAWIKAHPSKQEVMLQGDTAILTFYDSTLGPERGVRSADVFVHVDGHWRALYSQHAKPAGS